MRPITYKDEEALKTSDNDSEFLILLSTLRKYCYQVWLIAQAGSLEDESCDSGSDIVAYL